MSDKIYFNGKEIKDHTDIEMNIEFKTSEDEQNIYLQEVKNGISDLCQTVSYIYTIKKDELMKEELYKRMSKRELKQIKQIINKILKDKELLNE